MVIRMANYNGACGGTDRHHSGFRLSSYHRAQIGKSGRLGVVHRGRSVEAFVIRCKAMNLCPGL